MNTKRDLWEINFDDEDVFTPKAVLKEQAALLAEKTQFLVTAEVETVANGSLITHFFRLVAPALDDYRYELFRVRHAISLYPADVFWKGRMEEVQNEEALLTIFRKILTNEDTVRVIKSLMAQSRD